MTPLTAEPGPEVYRYHWNDASEVLPETTRQCLCLVQYVSPANSLGFYSLVHFDTKKNAWYIGDMCRVTHWTDITAPWEKSPYDK